jgi:hypothetical protein
MSSEQVAGILRQCSQQVRLVVARSVREPTTGSTTTDTTMNTPPLMSQRTSLTSENLIKTTNNIDLASTRPSLSTLADNESIKNSSQNKILLRTERLLESNHNFEKLLENLREQVRPYYYFLLTLSNRKKENRTINYLKKENRCVRVTSFSRPSNTYIYFFFTSTSFLFLFIHP